MIYIDAQQVKSYRYISARTPKSQLYESYLTFCDLNDDDPAAKNHFFKILYQLSPLLKSATLTLKGKRTAVVKGIRLK